MKIKNILKSILLTTTIFTTMETQAQSFKTIETTNLKLQVYNASENSFGVASVIVSGKTDAVLIDAQFTLADAEKVAQEIKNSGKNLTAIYVSHGDPDFYFGLEIFKKYFPEVTAYASPETVEHIKATAQKKLEVWGERLGKNITSNVVLPQVLKALCAASTANSKSSFDECAALVYTFPSIGEMLSKYLPFTGGVNLPPM